MPYYATNSSLVIQPAASYQFTYGGPVDLDECMEEDMEVTAEEYLHQLTLEEQETEKQPPQKQRIGVAGGGLLGRIMNRQQQRKEPSSRRQRQRVAANVSTSTDPQTELWKRRLGGGGGGDQHNNGATHCSIEVASIASEPHSVISSTHWTVASGDTVKASNKTQWRPAVRSAVMDGSNSSDSSGKGSSEVEASASSSSSGSKQKLSSRVKQLWSTTTGRTSPTSKAAESAISPPSSAPASGSGRAGNRRPRPTALSADYASDKNSSSDEEKKTTRPRASTDYAAAPPPSITAALQRMKRRIAPVRREDPQFHSKINSLAAQQQAMMDESIRCGVRLDGVDVLSLGPAYSIAATAVTDVFKLSFSLQPAGSDPTTGIRLDSLPPFSLTGKSLCQSWSEMVRHMVWFGCGRPLAEVILESGTTPGDRWTIKVDPQRSGKDNKNQSTAQQLLTSAGCLPRSLSTSSAPAAGCGFSFSASDPALPVTTMEKSRTDSPKKITHTTVAEEGGDEQDESNDDLISGDYGSPLMPAHELWPKLWGRDSAPVTVASTIGCGGSSSGEQNEEDEDDDDFFMNLAAKHSIPIDLDSNSYSVTERGHLESIHAVVEAKLQMGDFRIALAILQKLLMGLPESDNQGSSEDSIEANLRNSSAFSRNISSLALQTRSELRFLRGATLHNIGILCLWMGDFKKALEHFDGAVQERRRTLGEYHPDVSISLMRKSQSLLALGRLDDASVCMYQCMTPNTFSGDSQDHSTTSIVRAKVLNNIGVLCFLQDDTVRALEHLSSALEIQRFWLSSLQQLGIHRDALLYDTSMTLVNIGKVYLARSDHDLAYYVYEEALLLQTTAYAKDHDLVLDSLTSLAIVRAQQGRTKKAIHLLQGCLRCKTKRWGRNSAPAMDTIGLMGLIYLSSQDANKDYDEGKKSLSEVKTWQADNLPPSHAAAIKVQEILQQIEEQQGKAVSVWV